VAADWSTTLLTDTAGTKIPVCPAAELQPGGMRLVEHEGTKIGVFNCDGTLYAIEDRCSHDNGPLAEGEFDAEACTAPSSTSAPAGRRRSQLFSRCKRSR
jgi:hypothetical protein